MVGSPHQETVGQWIKPGKPFCEVGDPHRLEAHLIVDQSDIHLIKPGDTAWIKIYGRAESTIKSQVSEIAKRSSEEVPTELSEPGQRRGRLQARPQDRHRQAAHRRLRGDHPDRQRRHEARARACAAQPRSTAAITPSPGGWCAGGTRSSTSRSIQPTKVRSGACCRRRRPSPLHASQPGPAE